MVTETTFLEMVVSTTLNMARRNSVLSIHQIRAVIMETMEQETVKQEEDDSLRRPLSIQGNAIC